MIFVPLFIRPKPWKVDSGASHHITPDAHNLHTRRTYRGNRRVCVGNGAGTPISVIGFARFTSSFAPNTRFMLKNLLHVPGITNNPISASRFVADNNVFIELNPTECVVKSQVSRKLCGRDTLVMMDCTALQISKAYPALQPAIQVMLIPRH